MKIIAIITVLTLLISTSAKAEMSKEQAANLLQASLEETQAGSEALTQLQATAENGDPWGQEAFGSRQAAMAIIKHDLSTSKEAASWFYKAAMQGLPEGAESLGDAYMKGEGIKRSTAEAAKWYKKAADGFSQRAETLVVQLSSPRQISSPMQQAQPIQQEDNTPCSPNWIRNLARQIKAQNPNASGAVIFSAVTQAKQLECGQ